MAKRKPDQLSAFISTLHESRTGLLPFNDFYKAFVATLKVKEARDWPKWKVEQALASRIELDRSRSDRPKQIIRGLAWAPSIEDEKIARQIEKYKASCRHGAYFAPHPYWQWGPLGKFLFLETVHGTTDGVITYTEIAERYAAAIPEMYRSEVTSELVQDVTCMYGPGPQTNHVPQVRKCIRPDDGLMNRKWGRPEKRPARTVHGVPDAVLYSYDDDTDAFDQAAYIREGQRITDYIESRY